MALVAAAVLLAGIDQGDLRIDGAIYGWVSRRMALTGDWLNLYYDWGDRPYFNKPPLQFWLAAASIRLFGATTFAVRLPSVLFGFGCIALTWVLARRRFDAAHAAFSGIVLATTYTFTRNTVGFRLDAGVTFFFLAMVWAADRLLDTPPRAARPPRGLWLTLGAAAGLGLMAKGGAVLMALPVVLAAFAARRRGDLLASPGWLLATAATLLIAAPWHLYMLRRWDAMFFDIFFSQQIADRFREGMPGTNSWTFYLRELLTFYWPWLPAAAVGVWRLAARPPAGRRDALLLAWIATVFVLIHLVNRKYDRYLLPLFPALALAVPLAFTGRWWAFIRARVLPFAGLAAAGIVLALEISGAPLRRTSTPELHQALTVLNPALASPTGAAVRVYVARDLREVERCKLYFYSSATNAAPFVRFDGRMRKRLKPGDVLVIDRKTESTWRLDELPLETIAAGRSVAVYRVRPTTTDRSTLQPGPRAGAGGEGAKF
jgi:4-amino-4-deoxy-L-arabinose transferase-like glycosyltransferase